MALTDPLLGIFNDRYLYETLSVQTAQAHRTGQSLSVVMADVDRLKQINDSYGRTTGDAVLQHIVGMMRATLRQADWMARYGGDEFVAVLPETHLDGAYAAAERMRRRFTDTPFILAATTHLSLTASFGVACIDALTGATADINVILQNAVNALLQSKRAGRNRVTCELVRAARAVGA